MNHNRFLVVLIAAVVFLIGAAGTFTLAVDPYGLMGTARVTGFSEIKPRASNRGKDYKAELVRRTPLNTLILGNSRAEIGFDPDSPAWPLDARPVINAAAAGTGLDYSIRMFQHALAFRSPRLVVLGLDFNDFLRSEHAVSRVTGHPGPESAWFSRTSDGAVNSSYPWRRVMGLAEQAVSLDALIDSVVTVASQRNRDAPDLRADGFNPLREYPALARMEGYGALFAQKDREYAKAKVGRRFVLDERSLAALDRLMDSCAQEGIALRLVIYPFHVRLNELLYATELWPTFEAWKAGVARLADRQVRAGVDVLVWDFSGYNAYTSEMVPQVGDKATAMHWYWEAGHFKSSLGDIMISAMFRTVRSAGQVSSQADETPPVVGLALSALNVEEHNRLLRIAREEWLTLRAPNLTQTRGFVTELTRSSVPLAPGR